MTKAKLLAAALAVAFLTGCTSISEKDYRDITEAETTVETLDAVITLPPESGSGFVIIPDGSLPEQISEAIPARQFSEYSLTLEAEWSALSDGAFISAINEGYSGDGYVAGFSYSTGSGIFTTINVPSTQHYDLVLRARADETARCYVTLGDESFSCDVAGGGEFADYLFSGSCLSAGTVPLKITGGYNELELDMITLRSNYAYYNMAEKPEGALSDDAASPAAVQLYQRLCSLYGQYSLTAQYVSSDDGPELDIIEKATEQLPLIRIGDLNPISLNQPVNATTGEPVKAALEWCEQGGISSLMWYWNSPSGTPSVYADRTDFDLVAAVTDIDIATAPTKSIEYLWERGWVSDETMELIRDIDNLALQLVPLRDADYPILWRPMHEAGSMLYWWDASGADAYKWLWELMYRRLTDLYAINNLIWVWNGSSADYYPGNGRCDIVSVDSYANSFDDSSRFSSFHTLYDICQGKKPLALAECSTLPSVSAMRTDNALWLFCGLWYGNYLADGFGEPKGEFTNSLQLYNYYNSESTLSLAEYKAIIAAGE